MKSFVLFPLLVASTFGAFGQSWDAEYIPAKSGYPDQAIPEWKVRVESKGVEVKLRDEVLSIDTSPVPDGRVVFEQTRTWNGEAGSEVEVEVRVVAPVEEILGAGQILFSGPKGWQSLVIGSNFLALSGRQPKYQIDMMEFQKVNVRITPEGMAEVRVRGDSRPILTAALAQEPPVEVPALSFGDVSKTLNNGGHVEWKSLRWKQGTAE